MYKEFYGLARAPFEMAPDPAFLYLGEAHREGLATLVYGVQSRKGFVLLTGEVGEVESVLDAWNVARQRDPDTGDVAHPSLVYVLDAQARIAYATRGGTRAVLELLGRV